MLKYELTVSGVDRILREINAFDKQAQTVLRREIRDAVGVIKSEAEGYLPSRVLTNYGGWIEKGNGRDLSWNAAAAGAGLKKSASLKKVGGYYRATGSVINKSPQMAIFGLAGASTSRGFARRVTEKYGRGPWPRALGPAWSRNVDKVRASIEDAIVKAAAAVGR